jgi:hypothetical protein
LGASSKPGLLIPTWQVTQRSILGISMKFTSLCRSLTTTCVTFMVGAVKSRNGALRTRDQMLGSVFASFFS